MTSDRATRLNDGKQQTERPWRPGRLTILASLCLLAGACGGASDAGEEAGLPATVDGAPSMSAAAPPIGSAEVARADLAQRLGVETAAIEIVSVREVTWRDGSIGCPRPGMQYTQALVNGSQIVLRHAGVDYHYHSGGGRNPFYCSNPQQPLPEGAGDYGET